MCSTNSTSPSLIMPDLTVNRSFWSKAEYAREFLNIGLTEPLTVELLRKKFKKASLKCHPDKPDGSHKLFQTLQDYYDFLMVEATALNTIHDHSNIVVEEESEEEPVVEESIPAATNQNSDDGMDELPEPIYEAGATDIPCYEDDDIDDVDESFEEPTVLSSKEKREALWQKKADEIYHGPADPNRKFYYAITDRNRCQKKVPKRQLVLGIPVQSNLSSTASSLQRAALTVKRNQTWYCIEAVDKSKPRRPAVRESSLQQEYMKVIKRNRMLPWFLKPSWNSEKSNKSRKRKTSLRITTTTLLPTLRFPTYPSNRLLQNHSNRLRQNRLSQRAARNQKESDPVRIS